MLLLYFGLSLLDPWGATPAGVQELTLVLFALLGAGFLWQGWTYRYWGLERAPQLRFLRYLLLFMLLGGLYVLAGDDAQRRLHVALHLPLLSPAAPLEVDITITPPPHTGQTIKTLSLRTNEMHKMLSLGGVPEDSEMHIRVRGTIWATTLVRGDMAFPFVADDTGSLVARVPVTDVMNWSIRQGSHVLAQWPLLVINDLPPVVHAGLLRAVTTKGLTEITLEAVDDYRLSAVYVSLSEVLGADDGDVRLLKKQQLPFRDIKALKQKWALDFGADFVGGRDYVLDVVALDDAEQRVRYRVGPFTPTPYEFDHPLAVEIDNVRQKLLTGAEGRMALRRRLLSLTLVPADVRLDPVFYLGLRSAYWRLSAHDQKTTAEVARLLWDISWRLDAGARGHVERDLLAQLGHVEQGLWQEQDVANLLPQLQILDRLYARFRRSPGGILSYGDEGGQIDQKDLRRLLNGVLHKVEKNQYPVAREMISHLREALTYNHKEFPNRGAYLRYVTAVESKAILEQLIELQKMLLGQSYKGQAMADPATYYKTNPALESQRAVPPPDRRSFVADREEWVDTQQKLQESLVLLGETLEQAGIDTGPYVRMAQTSCRLAIEKIRSDSFEEAAQNQSQIVSYLHSLSRLLAQEVARGQQNGGVRSAP